MEKEQGALVPSERPNRVESSVINYYILDGELYHIEWPSKGGSVMAINVDRSSWFSVTEEERKNAQVVTREEFDDILQGR